MDVDISQLEPAVLLSTSADYDMLEIDPDYNNQGGKAPENYFHFDPSGLLSPTELYLGEYLYGSFYNSRRNPPTFKVNFTKDGEFKVKVGNLALFSKLRIRLDGNTIFDQNVSTNTLYSVFIPAGEHEIKVDNSGTGAMKINEYEFHEYAPNLRTFVYQNDEYAAGWMQNRRYNWHYVNNNGIPGPVQDGKIYLDFEANGTYEIEWYNQDAQLDSVQTFIFTGDEMVIDAPDILWDGAFEITFIAPVQQAFSASPLSGYLPLAVQFTDESTVFGTQIDEWNWDFGDGNTSTNQNPQHIYQQEGLYTVSLEIVANGRSITLVKENLIEVIQPLVADFTSDTTIAVPDESIQFYDLSLGEPNSWMWAFGDNTLSFAQNPQHLFEDPGLYSVSLFVQNQSGSDIITKTNYIQIILPLTTAFSVDEELSTVGGEIQFFDGSTGNPDWWHWDFGDGTGSTEQNPVKAYESPGNFSVKLVSGNQFFQDSLLMDGLITILEPLDAEFFAQPLLVWQGDVVQFSDLSGGNPDSWYWDFGDGNHANVQHPAHVYETGGFYSVKLVISDALQADSITRENFIHVRDTLDADFTADTTIITIDKRVYFTDLSKGNPESWFWNFGDGFASNLQNPNHKFKFTGTFSITLRISRNDSTDFETKTDFIKVIPNLVADFSVDTIYAVPGEIIHFFDESTGNPDTWIWDYGNATVGFGQNTETSYANPGSYTVSLFAMNEYLSDTIIKENLINIIEPVVSNFSVNPMVGKIGEVIHFTDQTTGFPDHWEWWFGNGDTAYIKNPESVYYEPGFYDITLVAGNDFLTDTITKPGFLHIEPPYYRQDIPIGEGWSGISTYVQPVFSDVTEIFAPMEEALVYAMNQQGIYIPEFGINTIQFWDVSQGMIVYTIQPDTLTIAGYSVVDNEMSLPAGWSFLPVVSPCPHQTDLLKSIVGENLRVIKEIGGNKVYWPEMFIETLNIIRPGELYLIYMESEQDFTFPACD
jgi:PKD repeat protein